MNEMSDICLNIFELHNGKISVLYLEKVFYKLGFGYVLNKDLLMFFFFAKTFIIPGGFTYVQAAL